MAPTTEGDPNMAESELHVPTHPVRVVTAASLFDGHDASINIMRRILQAQGAEVIHLGHNRSVDEVVTAAMQEDVQGIAISSYQGGHVEYFSYLVDRCASAGAGHVHVYGGGGGVIVPAEIASCTAAASPRSSRRRTASSSACPAMINPMIARVRRRPGRRRRRRRALLAGDVAVAARAGDHGRRGRCAAAPTCSTSRPGAARPRTCPSSGSPAPAAPASRR